MTIAYTEPTWTLRTGRKFIYRREYVVWAADADAAYEEGLRRLHRESRHHSLGWVRTPVGSEVLEIAND